MSSRVFTVYPLITIFAADEAEAARKLFALDDLINAQPDVDTALEEECYERLGNDVDDEEWRPVREDVAP